MKHFKQIMMFFVLVFLILPGVAFSAMSNMTPVLPIGDAVTFYAVNNANLDTQMNYGLNSNAFPVAVTAVQNINLLNEKMNVNNDTGTTAISPAVIGQDNSSMIVEQSFTAAIGVPLKMPIIAADNKGAFGHGNVNLLAQNKSGKIGNREEVTNMTAQAGVQGADDNMGAPRKILTSASNFMRSLNAVQYNQMGDHIA
jgi:hypothetical protein